MNQKLPGNPHLLKDPRQQQQAQHVANAQMDVAIKQSAIRIYEHLAVEYALQKMMLDEDSGITPELTPQDLLALAEKAEFMAPFSFLHLGLISPNPNHKEP